MGMFPAQNYGADFVNAMAATSGMLNDRQRLGMEERKQAKDAETRDLQNKGLELENQQKSVEIAREERLNSFMELSGRMQSGAMVPEDYGTLAGVTSELMKETPYLPNDPAEIPRYKQSVSTLLSGIQNIRSLPANNYTYTREDNVPEVNAVLDSFQTLLSKDRTGKEFVDADGSVTGKAGSSYRTGGVGGFAMMSGKGDEAAFTPLFSVTDVEGRPLVGADGKIAMVPSTKGQSNGSGDAIRKITPEELFTKAGYAYRVLDVAEKLGLADPEKRKQYISNNLPALMGKEGAKELLKNNERQAGIVSVDPTHDVYNKDGKLISRGAPKVEKKTPHIAHNVGVGNGMEQDFQYNEASGKYDIPIGKPTAKHAPRTGKESKETKAGARTIKEITDEYQSLKGRRDAQWGADEKEWRKANAERASSGMPALSWEEYFGGKSSSAHAALTQDMYQLRDVASGHGYDLIRMKPSGMKAPIAKTSQGQPSASAPKSSAPNRPTVANQSPSPALSSARPIKSQPGKHLVTLSDGTTWIGSKGAKGWVLESKAQIR